MNWLQPRRTKLLAINFGGIGDEVLFLPTLATIRAEHPDWHITLLLEPRSKSISQVTNLVDATIEFDIKKRPLSAANLLDLLGLLKDGGYHLVVSSGSSPLVSMLLFLSGIPIRIGYDSGKLSRMLLTNPVKLNRHQYAADMYHDLVGGLNIQKRAEPPALTAAAETKASMRALLADLGLDTTDGDGRRRQEVTAPDQATDRLDNIPSRLVLLHPGTSRLAIQKGIFKTWSTDSWAELISLLCQQESIQPILAGGPDDQEIITDLEKRTEGTKLISVAGKTKNLSDLSGIISLCDLMICVDSAPMHLAVALKTPLVALFGPTDENKLLPTNPLFRALRGKPLSSFSVRPELHSPASSPTQPGERGVLIPPDTVFQAAMDLLRLTSARENSPGFRL